MRCQDPYSPDPYLGELDYGIPLPEGVKDGNVEDSILLVEENDWRDGDGKG